MNYYILPKNNLKICIFLSKTSGPLIPYISYSLIYYLNDVYNNLLKLENIDDVQNDSELELELELELESKSKSETKGITLEYINKIVNPFEFIYTNVPGTFISVSKVKPDSSFFFDLMEIFQICNIVDLFSSKKKITIANFTPNYTSSNYLLNMLREENEDITINENFDYNDICDKYIKNTIDIKIDIFIFEFKEEEYSNLNQYIKNVLLTLYTISKYQSPNGISIIKFDGIFYKIIIDVLLILSAIFQKVYLIKPNISKITKGERYIICKNFDVEIFNKIKLFDQLEENIKGFLINKEDILLDSLLKNEIPYYYLNKIEESNSVIGQQQLEAYNQIINIFKNKNKEDKIENLKRSHIQKCIQWCEKNQIPHNKFTDKINIFLNTRSKDIEDEHSI